MISPNHRLTAYLLDRKRLGCQRKEAAQLLMLALRKLGLLENGNTRAWANHPALRLWFNGTPEYLPALYSYIQEMRFEWIRRGYKDVKMEPLMDKLGFIMLDSGIYWNKAIPRFSNEVYVSHRAKLLQKNYEYYYPVFRRFGLEVPTDWREIEYVWEQPY